VVAFRLNFSTFVMA